VSARVDDSRKATTGVVETGGATLDSRNFRTFSGDSHQGGRVLRAAGLRRSPMVVEPASDRDLPDVHRLLERSHLPLDGVDDHVRTMVVARDGAQVVGVAALELYADGALLRSVAVDQAQQGRRLGHQLTEAALSLAETHGAASVFLLTTTAERFFPRFGFEPISRDDVPPSVQASVEFRSACPASAIVMRKRLATTAMTTVLFACVHNAGRSQMAAVWFNLLVSPAKARAISAGTDPGPHVHPEVVAAMREVGVELSNASPTRLTPDLAQRAQVLVTMGCGDECPVVPGAKREDWPLEDPKGKPIARVREIRNEIRQRVERLLHDEGWSRV
jgi:arsenate reductase (thioredoxin)